MMKTLIINSLIALTWLFSGQGYSQNAEEILNMVDRNMSSDNRIMESSMTIHNKRSSRTITSKTWAQGTQKSFSEYLSPAAEKGIKMLKLEGQLWLYSPSTDRIIQISGHMLRQSVMGSDLSYEDMMDDRKLSDIYNATMIGKESIMERDAYLIQLIAKVTDVAYASQKIWVDAERFVPLKQELFAKSGKLLKLVELKNVKHIQGRWFPTTIVYKDMLKQGDGTIFNINSIQFNQKIPEYIFTKAALKQ